MANNGGPLGAFSTPLAAVEPNLLIAGIEATAAVQAWCWLVLNARFLPALPASASDWQWIYAVYAVAALVGLFLLGLAVEGLAGLVERAVIRKGENLRDWYVHATHPPDDWGKGQLWIWKSRQAADEFARRRLRILVSRNTWFPTATLTVVGLAGLLWCRGPDWVVRTALLLVLGAGTTALFFWLWVSANAGWHKAVADASAIGEP